MWESGQAMASCECKPLRERTTAETQAYAQAVDRHYEAIYAFLYRMAEDASLAEDLTQETFAAAWRSLGQFRGRASMTTWLHKIALNLYRDHRRRAHPPSAAIDEEEMAVSPDFAHDLIDQLGTEELRRKVQESVARLPEIHREAVVLHCYQGLKYREIAEMLGIPVGTVQYRLHAALGKLRAALGEEA